MKQIVSGFIALALLGSVYAAAPDSAAPVSPVKEKKVVSAKKAVKGSDTVTTASGLKYIVIKKGNGVKPASGQNIKVHYAGRLLDGTEFDNSIKRGEPIAFAVGTGMVIKGWDEGLLLMSKGEKRTLIIPPDLGYGPRGAGPIPPNATLVFDVELVDF